MFIERLKLQLFAAEKEDEEEPEIDEQETEEVEESKDDPEQSEEETDEETEEEKEETEAKADDNADGEEAEKETEEKPFMVFKNKAEHQQYMDTVIGKRLGEARKKQQEYDGVISTLQQYFDVNDFEGLKAKSEELLDDVAYKKGITKEQLKQQQRDQQELRELRAIRQQQQQETLVDLLTKDSQALTKSDPDLYGAIDVDKLVDNKRLMDLLVKGVSFETAYNDVFKDEIKGKLKAKVTKKVIDDVKAKGKRITENATKGSKAASIKVDVSKMTDTQLAEYEERAARGEKIVF